MIKHRPWFAGCHGVLVICILTIWQAFARGPIDQGHLIRELGSLSRARAYQLIGLIWTLWHLHGFVPFFCGKYHGTQFNFFMAAFSVHSNLDLDGNHWRILKSISKRPLDFHYCCSQTRLVGVVVKLWWIENTKTGFFVGSWTCSWFGNTARGSQEFPPPRKTYIICLNLDLMERRRPATSFRR